LTSAQQLIIIVPAPISSDCLQASILALTTASTATAREAFMYKASMRTCKTCKLSRTRATAKLENYRKYKVNKTAHLTFDIC
jgi:uncharacterized protein (UPF0179 family)